MFSLIAALVSYRRQHAVSAPSARPDRAVANDRAVAADLARAA